jgi:tRNA A-37 threonylcarbamoyl transferase component Bud32
MTGRTIGKYRFVEQLGRGASGVVYKAIDELLSREVAVKILHPDLANTEVMKRFRAEATTLAQLNHPGIATIYELVPTEHELLMVMELVRGETLDALSTRLGALPVDRAASLVEKILSALAYAHRAGIVHRDIKPANVMVTDAGDVKIMDFGIARVRGAEQLTLDGSIMGTPAYMSPEQVLGQPVDERGDLYAVGVVFYRLLTGALPFAADTPVAMLQRQLSDPPAPLRAHRDDVPAWCEVVLQRALAKSPGDRFQTADDFRQATLSRETGTVRIANAPANAPVRKAWLASALPLPVRLGAAAVVVLALFMMRGPAADLLTAEALPPVSFKTKALVDSPGRQRERDAQLVLAEGTITVTADDGATPLYSIPYDDLTAISYSRGRDPMWNSPDGPAPVVRTQGGTLGKLGIFVERHWIALRTDTEEQFVILRVGEELVPSVLTALEERTGHPVERVR